MSRITSPIAIAIAMIMPRDRPRIKIGNKYWNYSVDQWTVLDIKNQ